MIQEGHGNLLRADVEAIVNAVNTVGFMGTPGGATMRGPTADEPEDEELEERAVRLLLEKARGSRT